MKAAGILCCSAVHKNTAPRMRCCTFRQIPYVFLSDKRIPAPIPRSTGSTETALRTIPPTRSELALASCFRLLLALDGRLLVMLALANFSDNAVFCAGTLETLQSGVQGLVLTNAYFCHEFFPPFVLRQRLYIKSHFFVKCSL